MWNKQTNKYHQGCEENMDASVFFQLYWFKIPILAQIRVKSYERQ